MCRKTCDDGVDGTDIFPDQPDLIGDKWVTRAVTILTTVGRQEHLGECFGIGLSNCPALLDAVGIISSLTWCCRLVGAYLAISPEYCFTIESDSGVCGYVLAALDARDFTRKTDIAWYPAIQEKYPKPDEAEGLSPAEVIMLILCDVPQNKQTTKGGSCLPVTGHDAEAFLGTLQVAKWDWKCSVISRQLQQLCIVIRFPYTALEVNSFPIVVPGLVLDQFY